MMKLLFDGNGSHGYYRVVERVHDGRPSRLLLSGKATQQSGLALDDNPELLFSYNQRFMEIAMSIRPSSVLVVGGGAFTLPKAIVERFGNCTVDAVEIDSLLPQIARDYFELPDTPRLRIITQDGRSYIENCQARYDLIIVDAFDEYDIPLPLLTAQAAEQYARLLTPKGLVVLNIITTYQGKPSLAHQLFASFQDSFASTELYPADPEVPQHHEQNLLFVASLDPSPHLDYLQSFLAYLKIPSDDSLLLVD